MSRTPAASLHSNHVFTPGQQRSASRENRTPPEFSLRQPQFEQAGLGQAQRLPQFAPQELGAQFAASLHLQEEQPPRLLVVPHSTNNPVQRPPCSAPLCAPFCLTGNWRHDIISKAGHFNAVVEHETLCWAISYIIDLQEFLAGASQAVDSDTLDRQDIRNTLFTTIRVHI